MRLAFFSNDRILSIRLAAKGGVIFLFFAVFLLACSEQDKGGKDRYRPPANALFQSLSPASSGVDFVNSVEDGEDFNVLSYRNFYNGGGVAIGDFNGDGRQDLYFTANQGPNRLYLNQGNWKFKAVDQAGGAAGRMAWSTGVTAIDVNQDGLLDLYVCNSGDLDGNLRSNELFINQGNDAQGQPQFKEMAAAYGLADNGYGTQAAWLDYDQDGYLDVYVLNNSYLNPDKINPMGSNRNQPDPDGGDRLYKGSPGPDGHPVFRDVSLEAGIYSSRIGFGLGVGLGDLDGDGWTDMYISNDFWERDYLYINQQDGTFKEVLQDRIGHLSISAMGSDIADINNDGHLDIFSTDMLAADNKRLKANTLFDNFTTEGIKFRADYHHQILQNCLQLNEGNAHFQEIAHYSGVAATDWSWGALIFDFDNDGKKDIFVANGIYHDIMDLDFADFMADKEQVKELVLAKGRYDWRDFVAFLPHNPQVNYAFLQQEDLQFSNQAAALGLGSMTFSNGAAYGDLDNDGDLDLVINNVNQPALLYKNHSTEKGKQHLRIRLEGAEHNRGAIGAKVSIRVGEDLQVQAQYPSRGYLSSMGYDLVFGLANKDLVDEVLVTWPDGRISRQEQVEANQLLVFNYEQSGEAQAVSLSAPLPIFESAAAVLDRPAIHREEFFNDFDHEGLLHRQLSDPGPKIAKGDVNGDGLEDFLVLGSAGDADKLYLQQADGRFRFQPNGSFTATAQFESSCAAFFDADGDGDLDLMVGNGGNEFSRGYKAYAIRYYENVGGNLVYNPAQAPVAGGEVSCILPVDVDLDGDMDVFIGGRAVPNNYGLRPQSFLFIREGGQWVNQTPGSLAGIGMVTGGAWSDINGDGRPDLVLVGDWMPITILFTLQGATISDPFEVPNTRGWWTGVTAADLDGDGLEDLIATNWGINTTFKASKDRPLSMYVKDFDGNKKSDFIINWYPPADEQAYPFASKRDLHRQLPQLRKKTLKYADYAKATYESLFTEEERAEAFAYQAETLRSCIVWNDNKGAVSVEALPWQVQLTTQFAAAVGDVNNDQRPDIWLGGNLLGLSPQVGRSDAGRGVLLLNEGKRKWRVAEQQETGISIKGAVRDAQFIQNAQGEPLLLIGQNNDSLLIFKPRLQNGNPF